MKPNWLKISDADVTVEERKEGEILFLDLTCTREAPRVPEPFTLEFSIPTEDIYATWGPSAGGNRVNVGPDWYPNRTSATLASWMPLQLLHAYNGGNRLLLAISDARVPTEISGGVREETAEVLCRVKFFTGPVSPRKVYRASVRIDRRRIPFYEAIRDTVRWWEKDCGYEPMRVPDAAREPLDSLWYSFHQKLQSDAILAECAASRRLGMKTCIIDDGWQTDDNARGYAYCGDWEPTPGKIPDVKALADALHAMDVKLVLWYSVPFVGLHSKAYERFRGMFLNGGRCVMPDTYTLDPRYPEVREYLIGVYAKAQKEWGLDGFKLDFIDSFRLGEGDERPDPRRDHESLEEAVELLMTDVMKKLTRENKDVLIEFRQSYVGPAIREFGNMLRVGDCPNDPVSNRTGILNLRLTSGKTPVHSDMLMWNPRERAEDAARELASVLFAVPQISLKLNALPERHVKLLETYLGFWREHRDVLLDGELKVFHPEARYTLARAALGEEEVVVTYTEKVIAPEKKVTSVVNATDSESLVIKNAAGRSWAAFTALGEEAASGSVEGNLAEIPCPVCGFLYLI